jgi:hypothetical protein
MMDASGHEADAVVPCLLSVDEGRDMDREVLVTGAIIDSWVEPAGLLRDGSRLVLQVAPSGRPKDLLIVEAEASLVGDRAWLLDLGENLCHGNPVSAVGRRDLSGSFLASQIRLAR